MKKTNKMISVIILTTIIAFNKVYAQQCDQESGIYYSIDIFTNLKQENKRPVFLNCVTKYPLKISVNKTDLNNFICSLLKNCYYLSDTEIGFIENTKICNNKISKNELNLEIVDYEHKHKELSKYSVTYKSTLTDHTPILLKILQFKGKGWLFKADSIHLNSVSNQITIPINCYGAKNYFVLNKIYYPIKVVDVDKKMFAKIWKVTDIPHL